MIKLLAFDLDGTTITEHKYLSPGNREALLAAEEEGVILVPATGRMKSFLPEEITALPGVRYAITSNGAAVYDLLEDRAVHESLIPSGSGNFGGVRYFYRILPKRRRHHKNRLSGDDENTFWTAGIQMALCEWQGILLYR